MLSPRQIFEDNIRPAELLLKVFRLLEHDAPHTEAEMVGALRDLVKADKDEDLLVIVNEIFLGLIREKADVTPSSIKRSALCNLLRQAVVTACTALETYLPLLLRLHLPDVIKHRGRDFVPKDRETADQFKALTFSLEECVRVLADPDPMFVAGKMIGSLNFTYLSGQRGVHVTAALLGIEQPWPRIAGRLTRDEGELKKILNETVKRRNDIVHRADRDWDVPDGPQKEISYALALQAVDTVKVVCLCLDELVTERMRDLREQAARQPEGTA